ncbi:hypothetical protein [Wenxinia marina]|uniref:CAP-Gly protein n=1 Tax=Wenxinia marina DSM 24838 TaxID=1123501 RepID=A0A0D0PE43_9RHOB|nr:hypothetical protein [Wenxinia marina]KIQ69676.1 hypothetical protein Wenmar_02040 [Wenxinia marina DSM 24838]GGL60269.1 hypothetical protein GCM10011392_13470 [Wenxinia marina]
MATMEPAHGSFGTARRVSWGAIFAGTVVALALMILFATLGLAIGAAAVDPLYEQNPLEGLGTGSGIWIIVSQIVALVVGGYAAARLAGVPRTVASLLHGAAVWALTTLLLAWAAVAGGGAMFGAASTMIGNTARGAANAVEALAPDDVSFPDVSEVASQLSVEDLPPEVQQALSDAGVTLPQLRREAGDAFRSVVSAQEQQRALNIVRGALADALRNPSDIGEEVNDAIDSLVTGPDAVFGEEDRQQVLAVLERRLGIDAEDAEGLLQAIETRIEGAVDEMRRTLDQVQQQALEAAQAATSALATTATWLTIASLLGLAAALGGAFAGKPDGLLGERTDDVRY